MKARTEGYGTNAVDTVDFIVTMKRCAPPTVISTDTNVISSEAHVK
jgi:hypothetical protein